MKFCEEAEGDKAIPSEHFDADGELPEEFIFCAKCLKGESGEVRSGHFGIFSAKLHLDPDIRRVMLWPFLLVHADFD